MTPAPGIEQLRRELVERRWSEQDLADRIQQWAYLHGEGTLGITRSYVSEWLNGRRGVSAPYARRIQGVTKEKPGFWTRQRAFEQVRDGSNIHLLSFSLVRAFRPTSSSTGAPFERGSWRRSSAATSFASPGRQPQRRSRRCRRP
jgi:transcriptional regulator with XRE-family HTH domain